MSPQQVQRMERANELIATIGACGRKFFRRGQGIALFIEDKKGNLRWVDEYSGKALWTSRSWRGWKGFSNGGTLKSLAQALAQFIRTGEPIADGHLGPWPQWLQGGDLWAYGDDMQIVRSKAAELGVITTKSGGVA